MWSSMRVIWLFKCCPSGHRTLSRTTATASSCLTFLDNFRVFDGWILFGTFISQTAWRPAHEAKGAKVNVIRCYLWHHYLPPGRQIKGFVGLSRCNWLWHGLLLWLERKTEGLKHMDCIPYSGVGFFRTWYWESKSVIRGIWEDWLSNLMCSCTKRTVQWQQWMQQGKSCSPNDQSSQHIYFHRAPRLLCPSAWGCTKDEGQPQKLLWTTLHQAEDSC